MSEAIKTFFKAWTMTEDQGRDDQILGSLGATISYDDPRTEAPITDKDALVAYIAQFLPMCPPGAEVEVVDPVDVRRGVARCTIDFIMSADMRQTGQYFAELDGDGKIVRLVGFVGKGAE